MVKLTGIVILFLSARLFYENYIEKNDKALKKAEDIMIFTDFLYVNVMELKMPVVEGVTVLKFKISPFIDDFTDRFLKRCEEYPHLSVRENLIKQFSKTLVDKKIKRELNRFFKVVGIADKETVLSYKSIALKNCEMYLSEYRRESETKRKTAGALSFGVSTLLAIILI